MKLIDRLILQAKEILTAKHFDYDTNEDGFFEALGLDPENYRVDYPNGEYGYDILKALNEITPDIWSNDKEAEGVKTMINDEIPDYLPVKDIAKLQQLSGYEIENIQSEGDVIHFFLKRKVSENESKFRLLMILADGKKFMTEEY